MKTEKPEEKVETSVNGEKEARAIVRYLRISPRKVRLIVNAIRRKPVPMALATLLTLKQKAARLVEKGLRSAVANAKVKGLEEPRLVVFEIRADGGPTMKRFMSRSMGRADQILKRSTHLKIVLREGEKAFGPPPASPEAEGKAKKDKPKKAKAGQQQTKTREAAVKG